MPYVAELAFYDDEKWLSYKIFQLNMNEGDVN